MVKLSGYLELDEDGNWVKPKDTSKLTEAGNILGSIDKNLKNDTFIAKLAAITDFINKNMQSSGA